MWRQWIVLLLWGVIVAGQPAWGQESPLKITVRSEWEGNRTSAPLCLRTYLKWPKPELLEGQVEFTAFVEQAKFSRWTSPETALSSSEMYFWFLTPRPVLLDKFDRYVLEAEFLGRHQTFPAQQLDVDVPLLQKRIMVAAVVIDDRSNIPTGLAGEYALTGFERPLLLQGYLSNVETPYLSVSLPRVSPVDLPSESLRYLGLDALLLSHDMLDRLRPSQLEALRIWVLGGGSLALIQTADLHRSADEFVKTLVRNEWTAEQKAVRKLTESVHIYSPGLGQFIHSQQAILGDSVEWTRLAHLLLRLVPERSAEIERTSKLQLDITNSILNSSPQWRAQLQETAAPLEPRSRLDYSVLSRSLLPDSIQGMPFWLAASVLAGCLICIGPVDYFLLGAMKRRKWTWALFPTIALGFTGWMTHLAAEHNGRNDVRNWISIVDITPENEVIRTSRLELTYGASGRTVAHEATNQWWTDLIESDLPSPHPTRIENLTRIQTRFERSDPSLNYSPPQTDTRLTYSGSVPGHYIVDEPVQQWAPRMQRVTTLGADPDLAEYALPSLKWNELEAAKPQKISAFLQQHLSKDWQPVAWTMSSPVQGAAWHHLPVTDSVSPHTNDVLNTITRLLGEPLKPITTEPFMNAPSRGVFSLLSELSTTAGPDCEDLVMTSRPTLTLVKEVAPGRYIALRVVFPRK